MSRELHVNMEEEPLILNLEQEPVYKKTHSIEKQRLNISLFKRIYALLKISLAKDFFGYWLLVILALLCGGNLIVGSEVGDVIGEFYSIIVEKNTSKFYNLVWRAFLIVIGSSMIETSIKTCIDCISYRWRKNLVHSIQDQYVKDKVYYQMLNFDSRIDNPDQRITQDVEKFCSKILDILRDVIEGPMVIIYYAVMCFKGISWYSPLIVFGFWILAFTLNRFLMGPNIDLIFKQERLEGDFRYRHLVLRSSSESIAFYSSEGQELSHMRGVFRSLLLNRQKLIKWTFFINTAVNIFAYSSSILNYIVVALPVLHGDSVYNTPQYVSVASFRLLMLINGFTRFNNISKNFADFSGYASRLGQMLEVVKDLKAKQLTSSNGIRETSDIVEFEDVTVYTPNERRIVGNLSFKVEQGDHLLINGKSGSGKTSILRTLSGVWNFYSGVIKKPLQSDIIYLPQVSYLPFGDIFQQVCYPFIYNHVTQRVKAPNNEHYRSVKPKPLSFNILLGILQDLELEYLVDREENRFQALSNQEWTETLSPGERQRLSLARVLYHQPKYAILDEATSSIGRKTEEKFYKKCQELNITCISVGHKKSLHQYHNQVLTVSRDSTWTLDRTEEIINI